MNAKPLTFGVTSFWLISEMVLGPYVAIYLVTILIVMSVTILITQTPNWSLYQCDSFTKPSHFLGVILFIFPKNSSGSQQAQMSYSHSQL